MRYISPKLVAPKSNFSGKSAICSKTDPYKLLIFRYSVRLYIQDFCMEGKWIWPFGISLTIYFVNLFLEVNGLKRPICLWLWIITPMHEVDPPFVVSQSWSALHKQLTYHTGSNQEAVTMLSFNPHDFSFVYKWK